MSMQTNTAPTKRTARFTKAPAEAWQFTLADVEYLTRLTKRMVALGAWDSAERVTVDKTDDGENVQADYWYISPWQSDGRPAIEHHDGMYFLTGDDFTVLAKGKTVGAVTKRFARALVSRR